MWVVLVPFGTVGSKSDQIRDVTITAGLKLYVLSPLPPSRGGGRQDRHFSFFLRSWTELYRDLYLSFCSFFRDI